MRKESLHEKLKDYSRSDYYPFHMPGHKRNKKLMSLLCEDKGVESISPYAYDITEIDGFDNLHVPEGIIKNSMKDVSEFYESRQSYFLVNGSTCGILSAISAARGKYKKILCARNSHKALYNALFINKLDVSYVYPDYIEEFGIAGGIDPDDIRDYLKQNADVDAVYITSPTYEGIVSDVLSISRICHKYNIPLIVDEAHGAHFGLHEKFPVSALGLGADVVIQSLHKTLPSLTQTAILHVSKNSLIKSEEIEKYLSIYQTSSPSYVLMASIEQCMDIIMKDAFSLSDELCKKIEKFHKKAERFTKIKLLDKKIVGRNSVYDFDITKIVIYGDNEKISGQKLYDKCREKYHIQLEMASMEYVIAMTSIMDEQVGFDRLFVALNDIDIEIRQEENKSKAINKHKYILPGQIREPLICKKISDAMDSEKEFIEIGESSGRIAGDYIYLYPPGIPLVAPGEMLDVGTMNYLSDCIINGLNVVGLRDGKYVSVIK